MYWTDAGEASGIHKASMDGSMVTRINSQMAFLDSDYLGPRTITLDYEERRLYWLNDFQGLWTSDLEGGDAHILGNN